MLPSGIERISYPAFYSAHYQIGYFCFYVNKKVCRGSNYVFGGLHFSNLIMNTKNVKLVVFVPLTHSNIVRQVLGEAGAGKIGNYDFCSFSARGVGRFRGNKKSNPVIGESGRYESVEEERIEVVLPRGILNTVIEKIKSVHPYEEVAFDVYSLENI